MKKLKVKRILTFLTVLFVCALLTVPCFAWSQIPTNDKPNNYSFAYRSTGVDTYTIYAWSYDGTTYAVMTDDRYFNIFDTNWTEFNIYVPVGANAPVESFAEQIVNNYLTSIKNGTNGQTYDAAYNTGYNKGLEEGEIAERTILTLFSAPSYILSTVFDFEIFGINIYYLLCFVITVSIVAFILKRVL